MGNRSCFRNEKFNTQPFVMSADWILPQAGVFEFDFMMLQDRPNADDCLSDDQVQQIIEWLKDKRDNFGVDSLTLA